MKRLLEWTEKGQFPFSGGFVWKKRKQLNAKSKHNSQSVASLPAVTSEHLHDEQRNCSVSLLVERRDW